VGGLTHVALFTWKAETSEQDLEAMRAGLATLPGLIPEIRGFRFGPDAGLNAGNAQFGIVADFDDVDAYWIYANHPAHLDVIARLVRPITEHRTAVQMEHD
jgi:hypothetical protein